MIIIQKQNMANRYRSVRRNSGKRLKSRIMGRSQRRLNQQNTLMGGDGKLYCPFNYKYCTSWTSDYPANKRCVKSKVLDKDSVECNVRGEKRMGAAYCLEKKANVPAADYGEECKF